MSFTQSMGTKESLLRASITTRIYIQKLMIRQGFSDAEIEEASK